MMSCNATCLNHLSNHLHVHRPRYTAHPPKSINIEVDDVQMIVELRGKNGHGHLEILQPKMDLFCAWEMNSHTNIYDRALIGRDTGL